jgi:hypothetical protein
MVTLARIVAALLATAALSLAQAAVVPPPPPVLAHLATLGPAAWRARLGPTNLGAMLASADAEAIWRGHVDAIDASLRAARGDAAAFVRERARLFDYAGAIHVVVWLEQQEDALHAARWSLAVVAEADGHTDLAALADECSGWLGRALGRDGAAPAWSDLELTPPALHNGRVVAVRASRDDTDAVLARAAAMPLAAPPHPVAFRLDLELQTMLGLLRDRPAERDWCAALLGPATQRLTLQLGCAGPQVAIDVMLAFGSGDRGVSAGLFPVRAGVPELGWLLPPQTVAHRAGRADFAALWRAIESAESARLEIEPAAAAPHTQKALGLDVGKAVAAHLGDSALLLWRTGADDDHSLFGDACLVVPLRDEAAFVAGLKQLLPQFRWRLSEGNDGVVWFDRWAVLWEPECTLAIGNDVACFAIGPKGRDNITACLERANEGKPTGKPVEPVPGAPAGWNGAGRIDVTTLVARHLGNMLPILRSLLAVRGKVPKTEALAHEVERWLPLLRRHELATATTLAGTTKAQWQFRFLW